MQLGLLPGTGADALNLAFRSHISCAGIQFTKVNRLQSESLLYKTCNYSFSACNFAIVYFYKEKYW